LMGGLLLCYSEEELGGLQPYLVSSSLYQM